MRPAIGNLARGRTLFVKVSIIRFKVQGFVVECRIGIWKNFADGGGRAMEITSEQSDHKGGDRALPQYL